jgi:hypothetical protein
MMQATIAVAEPKQIAIAMVLRLLGFSIPYPACKLPIAMKGAAINKHLVTQLLRNVTLIGIVV